MFFGILFIALGLYLLYVLFDLVIVFGFDLNKFGEKWVNKTLWIWLPIYALQRLIKEVVLKRK